MSIEARNNYDNLSQATRRYILNLFFILDTSGSMIGERINQLNVAMAEAIRAAEEVAMEKEAELRLRVVEFNTTAKWIHGDRNNGVSHIDWKPLTVDGSTNTADAIKLVRDCMHTSILGGSSVNYSPIVILITDGYSNEPDKTREAIKDLKNSLKSTTDSTKDKTLRIAIGVVDANQGELTEFASVGKIVHEDNSVDENVPFVFNVSNVSSLKSLLRGITVSGMISSIGAGAGNNANDKPVIVEESSDDEDFEE